jgi:hypothetical protein
MWETCHVRKWRIGQLEHEKERSYTSIEQWLAADDGNDGMTMMLTGGSNKGYRHGSAGLTIGFMERIIEKEWQVRNGQDERATGTQRSESGMFAEWWSLSKSIVPAFPYAVYTSWSGRYHISTLNQSDRLATKQEKTFDTQDAHGW